MPWLVPRRAALKAACATVLGASLPLRASAATRADSPEVAIDVDLVASGLSQRWGQAMRRDLGWAARWRPERSGEVLRQLASGEVPVGMYLTPVRADRGAQPDEASRLSAEGLIHDRHVLAHTDVLLWGPASDPAGIRGETNAARALQQILAAQAAGAARWRNPDPGSALHALAQALSGGTSIRPMPASDDAYRFLTRAAGAVPSGGRIWLQGHPDLRLRCEVARSYRAAHPGGRLLVEWLRRPLAQAALRSAAPAWQIAKD